MRQTWHALAMTLGGPQLKEMRELAGFPGRDGRERFAQQVGVATRTLEGWESSSGHVPSGKEAIVRKLLEGGSGPALADVSNIDLISALAARLARYEDMERHYRELVRQLEHKESGTEDHDTATVVPEGGQDVATTHEPSPERGTPIHRKGPRAGWGPLE